MNNGVHGGLRGQREAGFSRIQEYWRGRPAFPEWEAGTRSWEVSHVQRERMAYAQVERFERARLIWGIRRFHKDGA